MGKCTLGHRCRPMALTTKSGVTRLGNVWNFLLTHFFTKAVQIYLYWLFGLLWITSILRKKLMWRRFRLLMVKFGQLLISTSGHTDKDRNIGLRSCYKQLSTGTSLWFRINKGEEFCVLILHLKSERKTLALEVETIGNRRRIFLSISLLWRSKSRLEPWPDPIKKI